MMSAASLSFMSFAVCSAVSLAFGATGDFWSCNFESDECSFINAGVARYWSRTNRATPTLDTGPPADHTTGDLNGFYMYMEASNMKKGDTARIQRLVKDSPQTCLSFWYCMYGEGMGSLRVFVDGDQLWEESGDQGQQWLQAEVDIAAGNSYNVIFEGECGPKFLSDIAIDDVLLSPGTCSGDAPEPIPTSPTATTQDPPSQENNALEISSSTPNIVEGSEILNITCTFRHQNQPDMDRLAYLTLSKRKNLDSNFTELITVNTFEPNHVAEIDDSFPGGSDGLALSKGPVSHLTAIYYNPTERETGEYRCESHGFDKFSRSIFDEVTLTLTSDSSSQSDGQQLEKRVEELERQLKLAYEEAPARCQSATLHWFQVVHGMTKATTDRDEDVFRVSEIFNSTSFYIIAREKIDAGVDEMIEFCKRYNGYLAEVNSEEEFLFIGDEFVSLNDEFDTFPHNLVTGASYATLDGDWVFHTHPEDTVYTGHWGDKQPDRKSIDDNQLILRKNYGDRLWVMKDGDPRNVDSGALCEVSIEP